MRLSRELCTMLMKRFRWKVLSALMMNYDPHEENELHKLDFTFSYIGGGHDTIKNINTNNEVGTKR